jgi:hypothetical protein
MSDPDLMASLRQSTAELANGESLPKQSVKADLNV